VASGTTEPPPKVNLPMSIGRPLALASCLRGAVDAVNINCRARSNASFTWGASYLPRSDKSPSSAILSGSDVRLDFFSGVDPAECGINSYGEPGVILHQSWSREPGAILM
jgi:hypothetical protein